MSLYSFASQAERVASYQRKTVDVALEITGALGYKTILPFYNLGDDAMTCHYMDLNRYESAAEITGGDVVRRVRSKGLRNFNEVKKKKNAHDARAPQQLTLAPTHAPDPPLHSTVLSWVFLCLRLPSCIFCAFAPPPPCSGWT